MILTILETMGHSKCKFKRIVTIMMLVILCTACGTEDPASQLPNVGEVSKEQTENLTENNTQTVKAREKSPAAAFEEGYRILNRSIFDNSMISWYNDETKQEIEAYAELVKGDMVPVWEEDSIFPQGLVMEMEDVIYRSLDSNMHKIQWEEIEQSVYYETMRELGMEKWNPDMEEMKILFPELKDAGPELDSVYDAYREVCGNEYCYDLFHIPTQDRDQYVLAMDSGGTAGICYIYLMELVDGEFVPISDFETQNAGYGGVIQYEGEFYYIYLPNNYQLKIYDGIRIYKIGEDMEYENLLIKYLPYEYVWKNLYNTSEGMKWEYYLEGIRDEITSDEYLQNGTDESGWSVYFGDEEKVENFIVPENERRYYSNEYHKIDFANIGIPVYMRKSNFYSSNTYTTWFLKCLFYLRDPMENSIVELENMEIYPSVPDWDKVKLVQMWFKEMEGKVYTFCLYHVSDYNYMLNVVRLEGNEVNRIRTDILSPRRHFVLTEGEKSIY